MSNIKDIDDVVVLGFNSSVLNNHGTIYNYGSRQILQCENTNICRRLHDSYLVILTTCRLRFLKLTEYVLPIFAVQNDHYPKATRRDEVEDKTKVAFHPPGPLPRFP